MSDIQDIKHKDIPERLDPKKALKRLKTGNERYQKGQNDIIDLTKKRSKLIEVQYPFAAILSCADSRVVPEMTFNQALGDLFVVRVAGNFVNDDGLASLEYATEFLNTSLIVVLGHSNCGAVAAAIKTVKKQVQLDGKLPQLVASIKPAIKENLLQQLSEEDMDGKLRENAPSLLDTAIQDNVCANVAKLKQSSVIGKRVTNGDVMVVGAVYDLATGEVIFFDEDTH